MVWLQKQESFSMSKILYALLLCGTISFTPALASRAFAEETQMSPLDKKIAELEKKKQSLEHKARYFGREAERLLFIDFLAYRNYIIRKEQVEAEVEEVTKQIEALKAEKTGW